MTKEQEEIIIEELEQLIEKTSFLREEEFYTLFTIHEVQNIASLLNMLKEKDAEIEKYKYLYQKALDNTISSDRENMKKDKMIDLILEFLSEIDLGYYTKEEGGEVLGIMRKYNKEDWKQYFERKLENERI